MIKNLADELTDLLNWIENPGLGQHTCEEANAALMCFCRGLVVGLRSNEPIEVRGDIPIDASFAKDRSEVERRRSRKENAQRNEPKCDPEAEQRSLDSMGKVDMRFRGGLRPTYEDMCIRPSIGEALKDPGRIPDSH
jgi:hypothetical protein